MPAVKRERVYLAPKRIIADSVVLVHVFVYGTLLVMTNLNVHPLLIARAR